MEPTSLDNNIIYQISEVAHTIHRQITATFRQSKYSITVEQFAVLTVLFYQERINQNEIAYRLNRDKTTIARVISNMVKHGYIQKKADDSDQRNRHISLTPLGREAQQELVKLTGQVYQRALSNITDTRIKQSLACLLTIKGNLT